MHRSLLSLVCLAVVGAAFAQSSPPAAQQQTSPFYPAPPPEQAPKVEQGAPLTNLSSPLGEGPAKVTRTTIDSEVEAQLFAVANRIAWGRYAKLKGAKTGEVAVTKQGALWLVKGRIDSVAPGTEGDWATIDGVVERVAAGNVQIRGEVAFRIAKVQKGVPCKVGGLVHFRRSGKSQVWRLVEGDNPCDGTQEMFDLSYEKPPPEKRPVPTQPRRS